MTVRAPVTAKAVCVYTNPVWFKTFHIRTTLECSASKRHSQTKNKTKMLKSEHNNLCYGCFYTTLYTAARGREKCVVQLAGSGAEAVEANGCTGRLIGDWKEQFCSTDVLLLALCHNATSCSHQHPRAALHVLAATYAKYCMSFQFVSTVHVWNTKVTNLKKLDRHSLWGRCHTVCSIHTSHFIPRDKVPDGQDS